MEKVNLRIFVGGLTLSTTTKDLYGYFKKFGRLQQAEVVLNPTSSKIVLLIVRAI